MNLTIFGATGRTGIEVVKQALAAGNNVTAYVRSPAKSTISTALHPRIACASAIISA